MDCFLRSVWPTVNAKGTKLMPVTVTKTAGDGQWVYKKMNKKYKKISRHGCEKVSTRTTFNGT